MNELANGTVRSSSPSQSLSVEDLLGDAQFRELLHLFSRRTITWEELLELSLPAGMSAVRTWELLKDVGEALGVRFPITDLDDNRYWYRRTFEMIEASQAVAAACAPSSRIYRAITSSGGHHYLARMRLNEIVASAKLDGLAITDRDADRMINTDRGPQNAAQKVLRNSMMTAERLPQLVGEPFSPALLVQLGEALLQGVDESQLPMIPPRLGLLPTEYRDEVVERFADRQLDMICDYANDATGDPYDDPVLKALMLFYTLRYYRPLGRVSSLVGRLATNLYGLKHRMPVLGMLPMSSKILDWEDGLILPPQVVCDSQAYAQLQERQGTDLTVLQTLTSQLMRLAVWDIEGSIDAWEEQDRRMRELLRADADLNQRQRSIIARALRSPESEFRIHYHQVNHAIAYTTARRDLLELAEKGYMEMQQRGKAFVFIASPGLQELIEPESRGE